MCHECAANDSSCADLEQAGLGRKEGIMGFSSDFTQCMRPLPTPMEVADSAGEVLEVLERLHNAWEAAGGNEEMTMGALVALGAATGLDEAALGALAVAGEVTVAAYVAVCVACLVSATGSRVWDLVASNDTPNWLQSQLQDQAEEQGISNPTANA
jgi:hypothetical protein